MRVTVVLLTCIATALAGPTRNGGQKVVGGSLTTINQYPFGAALLMTVDLSNYFQSCGGSILNQRSILSAAHCFTNAIDEASRWRVRVGSSFASSGGSVHNIAQIINHPSYNTFGFDNDISVLRLSSNMVFGNTVSQAQIAGANFIPSDNAVIWAIGWGLTSAPGSPSEQLRHVELRVVNQETCIQRYGGIITANMICTGWLDVGGRDVCTQDSGGPQLHNNVVVGVTSFGSGCADPQFPGVSARVSRFTSWIQATA